MSTPTTTATITNTSATAAMLKVSAFVESEMVIQRGVLDQRSVLLEKKRKAIEEASKPFEQDEKTLNAVIARTNHKAMHNMIEVIKELRDGHPVVMIDEPVWMPLVLEEDAKVHTELSRIGWNDEERNDLCEMLEFIRDHFIKVGVNVNVEGAPGEIEASTYWKDESEIFTEDGDDINRAEHWKSYKFTEYDVGEWDELLTQEIKETSLTDFEYNQRDHTYSGVVTLSGILYLPFPDPADQEKEEATAAQSPSKKQKTESA